MPRKPEPPSDAAPDAAPAPAATPAMPAPRLRSGRAVIYTVTATDVWQPPADVSPVPPRPDHLLPPAYTPGMVIVATITAKGDAWHLHHCTNSGKIVRLGLREQAQTPTPGQFHLGPQG